MKKPNFITLLVVVSLLLTTVNAQYSEPISRMEVPSAHETIEMDGIADDAYSDWQYTTIVKREGKALEQYEEGDNFDFNSRFKLTWDYNYLYLFIDVTDDVKEYYVYGRSEAWLHDNVEVFIDLDTNSASHVYADTSTIQIRLTPGLMSADGIADSLVESPGRADVADYKYFVDVEDPTGYLIEIAIPWIAAASASATMESFDIMSKISANASLMGFDLSVADSDGDGADDRGDRDTEGGGGAQAFWDLDTPIGDEDNAYQNRRVFGFIEFVSGHLDIYPFAKTITRNSLSIYPNPALSEINIPNYTGPVQICSVEGQVVIDLKYNMGSIDVSSLGKGIYYLICLDGVGKFIKQ